MSLVGKNRAIFSYNNKNKNDSNFMYKDFEKTKSYHSSFLNAKFIGTSLRAAHMKYCNFTGCTFHGVDFVGTNLRGSVFKDASFKDCIFVATVLDRANFKNASFENCYFLGVGVKNAKNFPVDNDGIVILGSIPAQECVMYELREVIDRLRKNDIIRRSNTLHMKKGRINTLTVMVLKKEYTEEELIRYLPILPQYVTTQFYTVSYLKMVLKKIEKSYTIKVPCTPFLRNPEQEYMGLRTD